MSFRSLISLPIRENSLDCQHPQCPTSHPTETPLRSTIRGQTNVLLSWSRSRPFVKSSIEEKHRGTAKSTRTNTLLNRHGSMSCLQHLGEDCRGRCSPSWGNSASSVSSFFSEDSHSSPDTRRMSSTKTGGSVKFGGTVKVYKDDSDSSQPIEQNTRFTPSARSVEKSQAKKQMAELNPSAPLSAGGRYLFGSANWELHSMYSVN